MIPMARLPTMFTRDVRFKVAQDGLGKVIEYWAEAAVEAWDRFGSNHKYLHPLSTAFGTAGHGLPPTTRPC